ncbi:DUF559 domain-containing protein [Actinomycetes bacterium KLBMP 9797]
MPPQPARPRELQWQVFRGSDAIRRRLLTPDQLRSGAWTRLRSDVYADIRLERDHELACRAAALRLPTGAAIAGPSAAYLYGVRHAATSTDDVHVIVPVGVSVGSSQGLRVHRGGTAPGEVVTAAGLRRTSPVRTAWDVAVWLDVLVAVAIMDTLLGGGVLEHAELAKMIDARRGERGWRRVATALDLADGAAQSPPESRLRVKIVLAGLPRPVAQYPVVLDSGLVLHPDLSWPRYKVAVEYDGLWHGGAEQLHLDRRRLNQLQAAGWIVLHVTARRLRDDFAGVLREIEAALRSRGWR